MLNHNGAFVLVANVETCGMVYPMVPAGGSVTNMILGDKIRKVEAMTTKNYIPLLSFQRIQ